MYKPFSAVVFIVALLSFSGVQAQTGDFDEAAFRRQAEQIRKDLSSSDKYSEITKNDRETVLSLLERMESRLQGRESVGGLPEQTKIAIFNDQEQLNTILTSAAEESRQVCRREIVVGSNRRQNVCMTLAERRRSSEMARENIGDMQRLFQPPSR